MNNLPQKINLRRLARSIMCVGCVWRVYTQC